MRDKPAAVVWDLHGCLANAAGRAHLVPEVTTVEENWYLWSKRADLDVPIVGSLARMSLDYQQFQVHICTACSEVGRECTEKWLAENAQGTWDYLRMRSVCDGRPDSVLKVEYIKELQDSGVPVVLAYEDLKPTADAIWEETGVPVVLINPAYEWVEKARQSVIT